MKISDFCFDDHKTFIIAELSANHNQDFAIALKTIKAMKDAGADAVKLQTYTADSITIDCDNDYFKIKTGSIWDGMTLFDLYKKAYTPWEWQPRLKEYAEEIGLICFSSPFDKTAVDFLEELHIPAYKIASPEITDIPLIEYIASKGKPVIISTGIATLADIELAVNTCRNTGNNDIAILKCTSAYPAPMDEINLKIISHLAKTFNIIPGISDHTLGNEVSIAAVAAGAKIVEKHFILDRNIGGPDASFSMEPAEFKAMIKAIRNVEKALGHIDYRLTKKQKQSRKTCRSLFVTEDIDKGEKFTHDNIKSIRPGFGLHPKYLKDIIGEEASMNLKKGVPLMWGHIFNSIKER